MKRFKTLISYTLYTLLATVFFSCDDTRVPTDKVTDSDKMIVYYVYELEEEKCKYEYRITDGENNVGFKFYSDKTFKIGDTIRIGK